MRLGASMMSGLFLLATVAVVPGSSSPALAHPDFSGTWSLDVAKSEGQRLPTSETLKVVQTEKSMTLDQTISQMGNTRHVSATYMLDGSPSMNTRNMNGTNVDMKSTAEWSENVLVIKTTWSYGEMSPSLTERFSLSDDKKTLSIGREFSMGGPAAAGEAREKQVFNKQ